MHIGERIKRSRQKAGIEIEDLAKRLKLSGEAVRSWERGDSSPRPSRYAQIASALGTTEPYIAAGIRSADHEADINERAEAFGSVMERLTDEQVELLIQVAEQFSRAR